MLPLEYSGPTLHRLEALDANRPLLFGLRQHKNYHFHPPCCTDWYMKYFAVKTLNANFSTGGLSTPIKLVDKAAAAHLIDETQVDEILGFSLGDLGIPGRLDFQRVAQAFDRRIGVFDE